MRRAALAVITFEAAMLALAVPLWLGALGGKAQVEMTAGAVQQVAESFGTLASAIQKRVGE